MYPSSPRLVCDPCRKEHNHDGCARNVRAFIDPDGPDWYACECSCNRRRIQLRHDSDKVTDVLTAYQRRYGKDALAALIAPYSDAAEGCPPAPADPSPLGAEAHPHD